MLCVSEAHLIVFVLLLLEPLFHYYFSRLLKLPNFRPPFLFLNLFYFSPIIKKYQHFFGKIFAFLLFILEKLYKKDMNELFIEHANILKTNKLFDAEKEIFSYIDVGENTAGNFYHTFVLGMLVRSKIQT